MKSKERNENVVNMVNHLEENDGNVQDLTPSSSQDTSSKVEIEIINFNSGYAGQVIQTILKKLSEANNHYGI